VKVSCTRNGAKFKSPLRVVVWFLERSRDTNANRCKKLKQNEANRQPSKQKADREQLRQEQLLAWPST